MYKKRHILKSLGFTMIEVVVVAAIMAAIGITGVSISARTIAKNRLISTADLVASTLDDSRIKSLGGISGGSWGAEIVTGTTPGIRQQCYSCPPGEEQIKETALPQGITISPPATGNHIIFQAFTGYVYSPTLANRSTTQHVITLQNDTNSINIVIPSSGKIFVETIQ